jgi:hypothetical protein
MHLFVLYRHRYLFLPQQISAPANTTKTYISLYRVAETALTFPVRSVLLYYMVYMHTSSRCSLKYCTSPCIMLMFLRHTTTIGTHI